MCDDPGLVNALTEVWEDLLLSTFADLGSLEHHEQQLEVVTTRRALLAA